MDSAKQALRKVRTLPVGFEGRAIIVAVMVLAAGLYGVELAEAGLKHIAGLDTAVMHALWGTSRPCRAKEIVFALLVLGHRVAPSMVVPYRRICWLARMARTRGTPQTIAQAVWEHRTANRIQGPMGQALKELSRLGWQATCGWWQWTYPGALAPVNMALESQEAVEHVVREELRKRELLRVERRRPRLFAGIGGSIHRGLTLAYLHTCTAELDKSILRGALTGAIWTAVRANERGLWPTRMCPYCDKQEPEDEEHLLWRCTAWKAKREPLIAEIMLLAKALKLGSLREWPPCIRLCGIIPDSVVLASGIGEGERWRKRCMDLGRVPRHWLQRPLEDVEDRLREVDRLAEAGAAWAAQDTHPWQLFAMKLHEMFLGVLRDCKGADDEAGSLFPTSHRKEPRNTYPWHLLQLPQPQGVPTPPPPPYWGPC